MGSAMAVLLILLVIVGTSSVVNADCSQYTISGLAPCYDAVDKSGDTPSDACCSTLKSWGIDCLCSVLSQYVNNLPNYVDRDEVLALPQKCELPVQSGYNCAGYIFP